MYFGKKAVKLFLSAKAAMVLRSHQKYRQIDGANYSTQLPFSVHTNVVPKLYLQSKLREESRKTFFSVNLRRYI